MALTRQVRLFDQAHRSRPDRFRCEARKIAYVDEIATGLVEPGDGRLSDPLSLALLGIGDTAGRLVEGVNDRGGAAIGVTVRAAATLPGKAFACAMLKSFEVPKIPRLRSSLRLPLNRQQLSRITRDIDI